jgi:hypothetical protein
MTRTANNNHRDRRNAPSPSGFRHMGMEGGRNELQDPESSAVETELVSNLRKLSAVKHVLADARFASFAGPPSPPPVLPFNTPVHSPPAHRMMVEKTGA